MTLRLGIDTDAEITRLTAALATSRAETAMAFYVAAAVVATDHRLQTIHARDINQRIRAKTPDDATAALAARDKAKDARIAELENALAARGEELTAAWHQIAAVTSGDDQ